MKKALSFKKVFEEGRYFKGRDFSLRVLDNELALTRLGVSVPTKLFSKATQRNRIKRLIREVFRKNKQRLNRGYDIMIRAKEVNLHKLGYNQIEKELLELFKTAGLLK